MKRALRRYRSFHWAKVARSCGLVGWLLICTVPSTNLAWADQAPAAEQEDEEADPFDKVLKLQPGLATHVKRARYSTEWAFGSVLAFAAKTCGATEEQQVRMKALARTEIKPQLAKLAKEMEQQFGVAARQPGKVVDASKLRDEATERILRSVLWPDLKPDEPLPAKLEKWREEARARTEYHHRTNATFVIDILADRLVLSPDQVQEIIDAITPIWKTKWDCYLQIMQNNPQFFPPLPDKCLKPYLSEIQFESWQTMEKHQLGGMSWQLTSNSIFRERLKRHPWFDVEQPVKQQAVAKSGEAQKAPPAVRADQGGHRLE